jgi:hypothetical protein
MLSQGESNSKFSLFECPFYEAFSSVVTEYSLNLSYNSRLGFRFLCYYMHVND